MPPHVELLDQRETLRKSFVGSVLFHALLAGSIVGFAIVQNSGPKLGSEKGGKAGSVAITPVNSIPLPRNNAPPNPLASDTKSQLPPPKEVPKKQPPPKQVVKPPEPKAIPIKGGYTKKEYARVPDRYNEQRKDVPNQLTSTVGRQLSSDKMAIQGSGRMGLGENAPFGNQFGAYAEMLRNLVASKWQTGDVDARIRTAPEVTVTFLLRRDGSIGKPVVSKSSGLTELDRSALRAILDAAPFPRLPPQFPKDQTTIDFVFELKR